jgi:hypothetical protein
LSLPHQGEPKKNLLVETFSRARQLPSSAKSTVSKPMVAGSIPTGCALQITLKTA